MHRNVAILRFSAIGDVVLCIPILRSLQHKYPNTQFHFFTKAHIAEKLPKLDGIKIYGLNFETDYKGISGLWRLKKLLQAENITAVADLHDVLRTHFLKLLCSGLQWSVFDKARKQKRDIIAKKTSNVVTHTTLRYAYAFEPLGFFISEQEIKAQSHLKYIGTAEDDQVVHDITARFETAPIGIAPFAKHLTKSVPFNELLSFCTKHKKKQFILFAGAAEQDLADKLLQQCPNVYSSISLSFVQQMLLMQQCSAMIAVDSSNMHLAALQGVPLISIWGATIPELGFAPVCTAQHKISQTKEVLTCRPCSVFGNKACSNKQLYACMVDVLKNIEL